MEIIERICKWLLLSLSVVCILLCCGSPKQMAVIENASKSVSLTIPSDEDFERSRREMSERVYLDTAAREQSGPVIMNAVRDEQTGEMVATDIIKEAVVVARFRHVAERLGKISISFDINVPSALLKSQWQMKFMPEMNIEGELTPLEPIFITGQQYRIEQLRGYDAYRRFLASIVTDSTDFLRIGQLEIFLERNFPQLYAMKTDSSVVSEAEVEDIFGVSRAEAVEHYTRHGKVAANERRIASKDKMYRKYVKSEIEIEGVRLDTVIQAEGGDFIYRYVQQLDSRPGLKKIVVAVDAELREEGRVIYEVPRPDSLVFYVSSLSSLADNSPHYRTRILERTVYDNTLALIDFAQGSHLLDTSLSENASELLRIEKCIEKLEQTEDYEIDSVVVTASCSPEGSYKSNHLLARKRSEALREHFESLEAMPEMKTAWIAENWQLLEKLVANDTVIDHSSKQSLLQLFHSGIDRDVMEKKMSVMEPYRYLREKIYPRLRTVRFGFHLHRRGMLKDTVHTTELDTDYMAGLEALHKLDYSIAAEKLRPYRDYNSALAFASAGYNNTAMEILTGLDQDNANILYLEALIHSRLGDMKKTMDLFNRCVELDNSMIFRANLDPELADIVNR